MLHVLQIAYVTCLAVGLLYLVSERFRNVVEGLKVIASVIALFLLGPIVARFSKDDGYFDVDIGYYTKGMG